MRWGRRARGADDGFGFDFIGAFEGTALDSGFGSQREEEISTTF